MDLGIAAEAVGTIRVVKVRVVDVERVHRRSPFVLAGRDQVLTT